jgi:hypothetical protein
VVSCVEHLFLMSTYCMWGEDKNEDVCHVFAVYNYTIAQHVHDMYFAPSVSIS